MSTALLRFQPSSQPPKEMPLVLGILAAALDASPEPMAVTENGKLLYANRSFAQLEPVPSSGRDAEVVADSLWQNTGFSVGARTLSLSTLRRDMSQSAPDASHLEMVGRMVGGVAHDFNNLLTGILLYCDLIKTKLSRANPLSPKIEEIRYAAEQGAGLIRQLMTVGREEKDAPRWVSFHHAVRDILPLLQHLLAEHIVIHLDLAAGSPRIALSLAETQQLILNLVLNARDAMPAGGTIHLETRALEFAGEESGSYGLEFTVKDTGTGMDPETASHIFDPFYTTKVLGSGTGIGLVTVKRIVERAGGTIQVDTNPGQGTRMTVRLPQIKVPEIEGHDHPLEEVRVGRGPRQSEIQQPQLHQSPNRGAGV